MAYLAEHRPQLGLGNCPAPCPSPPPATGQFSPPDRDGYRWFTPEYRKYPSNLSHLARVVRQRMAAGNPQGALPSESQIRSSITAHPCNHHLQGKMFLPRFGPDRCTGRGNYYGSIYIPFHFDGKFEPNKAGAKLPPPHLPRLTFTLDPALNWNNVGAGHLESVLTNCHRTAPAVLPGADDRKPVGDTKVLPYRWTGVLFAIFPPGPGNPRPRASRASGFLLDDRHLVTSAHVLYKYSKKDPRLLAVPESIVFIPGFDPGLNPLSSNAMPFGAFVVNRRRSSGASNFYVPGEWILSIPEDDRFGDSPFDFAVIDITDRKPLFPGKTPRGWMTETSPILASAAAAGKTDPEAVGRLILSAKGKGFRAAGYPADKRCVPMQTDDFEFAALGLPIGSPYNVLLHRADFFSGMSGSPVWLRRSVIDKRSKKQVTQRLLVGLVEGGRGSRFSEKGIITTYSTIITPAVLERLRNPSFLSSL